MASLPGIRGKQLAGDPQTRRTSNRIDLPPDWKGTSGGMPGRSMEIFVVEGLVTIADIELPPGGYAFLPAGSLGFNMDSEEGARILYFINDSDPESIIRSPIIIDTALLDWAPHLRRALRPKNCAATLAMAPRHGCCGLRQVVAAMAVVVSTPRRLPSSRYLSAQRMRAWRGAYLAVHAGRILLPARGRVNGGPLSGGETDAVWFLRETERGKETTVSGCVAAPTS